MIDTIDKRVDHGAGSKDEAEQESFKTWTKEEAQA